MTLFSKIGAGIDFLFGQAASSAKWAVSAPEVRKVVGVGIASALASATPQLTQAAALHSRTELLNAAWTGFLVGVSGATVSLLHRLCDDTPPSSSESPQP